MDVPEDNNNLPELSDLTFQQIYNTLYAGKKLAQQFANKAAAESFRVRLHHHKSKQDKLLEGLGMQVEEDRTVVSFKLQTSPEEQGSEEVIAFIQFAQPSPLKKYKVMIINDAELEQQLSSNGESNSA